MDLSELTHKRREHIKSCRDNNDNSHEIIAGLYSDPSHFIYELLQNADDAKASKVIFNLSSNSLEITHDGKELFEFKNVDSITAVNNSTKKNDINSIGTFGAGFKSVFAITKTPYIYSGDYHFKIIDFIVPEKIEPRNLKEQETIIRLPFNHSDISSTITYNQISKKLKELESESLLFLRNVKEIKWNTESNQGNYLSKIKGDKASIIYQFDMQSEQKDYLIFKKIIKIEDVDLNIVVAYLLNDNAIVPEDDAKLFVFFPTEVKTGLKFLVHAPYKTTPSRETIPFEDNQNTEITIKLAILIAESIKTVKDKNLLTVDFLALLPIDSKNNHPLYRLAFEKVKKLLETNRLIPSSINNYVDAKHSLLAREKELTVLLNTTDCSELFGRKYWLSTEITSHKAKELRDYLTKILEIDEIKIEDFCNKINVKFLKTKPDKWIIKFYSHIIKNKALYKAGDSPTTKGILRKLPIIRLENGSHIPPENDSGQIQVYISTKEKSRFKTIKKAISDNEEALDFLKEIGIKQPDAIAEIKEFIIPKYKSSCINESEYIEDFERVLKIWSESSEYRKPEVIDLLKECNCIRCKIQNNSIFYQKPNSVYFHTNKNLSAWYKGNPDKNIYFLDLNIHLKDNVRSFLESLGVKDEIQVYHNYEYRIEEYRRYERGINGFNKNYDIDGLDFAVNNISFERSIFLWTLLLKHTNRLKGYIESKANRNHSYQKESEEKTSKAIDTLNSKYWLYDKNNELINKPIGLITLDDLSNEYTKESDNIEKLVKILGFKLDKIKQFEEETGKKVISIEDYELLQKIKENDNSKFKAQEENSWLPEVSPEDSVFSYKEPVFKVTKSEDLSGQQTKESIEYYDVNDVFIEKNEIYRNSTIARNSKQIGDWGESVANRYLENKYPKTEYVVDWLNKKGNIGKGYDFVIRKDDKDVFYYEVKSKTDESPQIFQISGTQWNWAKKLYQDKKGNMYIILLVSNVGKKEPIITEIINPLALFDAGELDIDSVNIQLS